MVGVRTWVRDFDVFRTWGDGRQERRGGRGLVVPGIKEVRVYVKELGVGRRSIWGYKVGSVQHLGL